MRKQDLPKQAVQYATTCANKPPLRSGAGWARLAGKASGKEGVVGGPIGEASGGYGQREVATETAESVVSGRVWAGRASWLAGGQWVKQLRRQSFQPSGKSSSGLTALRVFFCCPAGSRQRLVG